jgi:hypothetical protein
MNLKAMLSAAVLAVGVSTCAMADVTGKAKFEGKAPVQKPINMAAVAACAAQHKTPVLEEGVVVKDGGLRDVVVSIVEAPKGGEIPKDPATIDQKGCQYFPHVIPVMIGQKILVKNSDPFLHNIHGLPENNPGFNFGQNNVDPGKAVPPMKEEEDFVVKCDVHPWMNARMYVFNHPYFAATKEDGSFAIKGLKDGKYKVKAQHPKLGEQEGEVTVKDGKGEVNFTFKPEEGAAVDPADLKNTRTVSITDLTGAKSECAKGCCEEKEQTKVAAKAK